MCINSLMVFALLFFCLPIIIFSLEAASSSSQGNFGTNEPKKQCGLPANLNELPDFAQDEIRAVWKDYLPGRKCDKEMLITEDILAVLAMFDKELERQGMKGTGEGGGGQEQQQTIGIGTEIEDVDAAPTDGEGVVISTESSGNIAAGGGGKEEAAETALFEKTALSTITATTSAAKSSSPAPRNPTPNGGGLSQLAAGAAASPFPRPPPASFINGAHHRTRPLTAETVVRPSKLPSPHNEVEPIQDQQAQPLPAIEAVLPIKRPKKQKIVAVSDYEADGGEVHKRRQIAVVEEAAAEGQRAQFEQIRGAMPFLRGASPTVLDVFKQVLDDPEIPSERRRMDEIHLLAVSYLSGRQLVEFNAWSADRRKKLHAREHQQPQQLSRPAREAFRHQLAMRRDEREQRGRAARESFPVRLKAAHLHLLES